MLPRGLRWDFFSVSISKPTRVQMTKQCSFSRPLFPCNYSRECSSELYHWRKEKENLHLPAAVQQLDISLLTAIFDLEAVNSQAQSSQNLWVLFQGLKTQPTRLCQRQGCWRLLGKCFDWWSQQARRRASAEEAILWEEAKRRWVQLSEMQYEETQRK